MHFKYSSGYVSIPKDFSWGGCGWLCRKHNKEDDVSSLPELTDTWNHRVYNFFSFSANESWDKIHNQLRNQLKSLFCVWHWGWVLKFEMEYLPDRGWVLISTTAEDKGKIFILEMITEQDIGEYNYLFRMRYRRYNNCKKSIS